MEHPAKLRIGLIGSGRVGVPMAAALQRAGHRIVATTAISRQSKDRVGAMLPGVLVKKPHDVTEDVDLLILAVPDDVLPDLVAGLISTGSITAGQMVVHTSGRYGVEVLHGLYALNALPMAIHPVMTFTGTSIDIQRMVGAPFGVTAPEQLLPIAQALVVDLGGEPVVIPEEKRAAYHAALAWSSNFLATVVNQGKELVQDLGVENPAFLLTPLLNATLENALRYGDAAMTGPISRGDADTVQAHREVLQSFSPAVKSAYLAMARLTAERAIAAGVLDVASAEKLMDVLSS